MWLSLEICGAVQFLALEQKLKTHTFPAIFFQDGGLSTKRIGPDF